MFANKHLCKLLPLFPYLVLLIPIAIFFSPVWLKGKIPLAADTLPRIFHPLNTTYVDHHRTDLAHNELLTDPVRQLYPWRQFSIDHLKQGHIPWWNPYNMSGTPHLANFQSATFYPLNLIFWLTNFSTGWSILVIAQQILAGLFLYWYLRHHQLHQLASIFGSLTWIFSGFFIAWLEWNTLVHVALWTPLILLSIDNLLYRNNPGIKTKSWYIILVFSLSAQFLAGSPAPWLFLTLFQFAYLIHLYRPNLTLKYCFSLLITYLSFLILVSPQLLSTYHYMNLSNRVIDIGNPLDSSEWFLPYQNLTQLIAPDFLGNPVTRDYWSEFNYTEFVSYIGVIPVFFIIYFLLQLRQLSSRPRFFFIAAFFAFILSTKNPLSVWQIKLQLPLLSTSNASRWIVVIDFCLSTLAAFGLNHFLCARNHSFKSLLLPLSILSLTILLFWLFTLQPNLTAINLTPQNLATTQHGLIIPTLELSTLILILCLSFILPHLSKNKTYPALIHRCIRAVSKKANYRRLLLCLISCCLIISTLTSLHFAIKFTPFSPRADLYPHSQITSYLHQHAGLYRYLTLDTNIMTANVNLPYHLYTIEGYDSLYLNDYGRLLTATDLNHLPAHSQAFSRHLTVTNYQSPLIDLLGVKYILTFDSLPSDTFSLITTEGHTRLYQNLEVFPRAFITPVTDPFTLSPDQVFPAQINTYQPDTVAITTTDSPSGYLVLTDAWHPDWTAIIDGKPCQIINWNGLRATIVPEGSHEVIYQYRYPQL